MRRKTVNIELSELENIFSNLNQALALLEQKFPDKNFKDNHGFPISISKAASLTGYSKTKIYKLIRYGKIPHAKLEGKLKAYLKDIEEFNKGEYIEKLPTVY
jgi:excisionase family DNA binding protein